MDVHQLNAQISEAKITAKSSLERIEIVGEQIESMNVRSPQDGIITTFEAKKNLMGRPVEIGTELLAGRRDRRRMDPGGRGSRRRHGTNPRCQEQAR